MVRMQVHVPAGLPAAEFGALRARERETSHRLQRLGVWRHLWRVAGSYANVSVFDVEGPDQLHDVLSSLPFFPLLTTEVTPLVRHPSSLDP